MKPSLYDAIGGEDGVRRLVDRFYDHMDQDRGAAHIRSMHARSLRVSREKLFLFLSGWLGGPDLYVQKFGHPMLRRRHLPFSIGKRERDEWLACMRLALDEVIADPQLRERLMQGFESTADHMRNRPEHDADEALRLFPGGFRPKGTRAPHGDGSAE
jgi:hemoglobin